MMKGKKNKIMLVVGSQNLRYVLKDFFEMMNYKVLAFSDGESAIRNYKNAFYHICLIDIELPKKDGYAVIQELHRINPDLPVILLVSTDNKEDRLKCFKSGCCDYVTKPFCTEDLLMRVEEVLRRNSKINKKIIRKNEDTVRIGEFTFHNNGLKLINDLQTHTLTKKEAQLLELLHEHQNKLIPREILIKEIWGESKTVASRSLDVFISKLRSYLKSEIVEIINIHGMGYLLRFKEL